MANRVTGPCHGSTRAPKVTERVRGRARATRRRGRPERRLGGQRGRRHGDADRSRQPPGDPHDRRSRAARPRWPWSTAACGPPRSRPPPRTAAAPCASASRPTRTIRSGSTSRTTLGSLYCRGSSTTAWSATGEPAARPAGRSWRTWPATCRSPARTGGRTSSGCDRTSASPTERRSRPRTSARRSSACSSGDRLPPSYLPIRGAAAMRASSAAISPRGSRPTRRRGRSRSISAGRRRLPAQAHERGRRTRREPGEARRGRCRARARTCSRAGTRGGAGLPGSQPALPRVVARPARRLPRTRSPCGSSRRKPRSPPWRTARRTSPCFFHGMAACRSAPDPVRRTLPHRPGPWASAYAFLNVRAPPFDDVRVRRALNYAVDRDRVAELVGTRETHVPTCQLLPPGIQGYTPSCPFTVNPNPAGTWTGPDMARARRLVAASGTRGMKVEFWGSHPWERLGRYFRLAAAPARLSRHACVRSTISHLIFEAAARGPRRRPQIGLWGWGADSAAPFSFLQPLVSCSAGVDEPLALLRPGARRPDGAGGRRARSRGDRAVAAGRELAGGAGADRPARQRELHVADRRAGRQLPGITRYGARCSTSCG